MAACVPILMYHHVTPRIEPGHEPYVVKSHAFAEQMSWLSDRGYQTITIDDLIDGRIGNKELPERSVVITFDDGFEDCFDHAVPILEGVGLRAVFFLVAGLIGAVSRWQLAPHGQCFSLMGWDAVLQLRDMGFGFGSHTVSHSRLAELSAGECRDELGSSRQILEERLGQEVVHLAYPFGSFDPRVRALAEEAGYRSACSVRSAVSCPDDDVLALPRVAVRGSDSLNDFVQRLDVLENEARASAVAIRSQTRSA